MGMKTSLILLGNFYFLARVEAQDCNTCDYDAQTNEVMEFQVQGNKVKDWKNVPQDETYIQNFADFSKLMAESGCAEGSVDSPKCWHFVRVTQDFGFQQGAFDTNSSNRIVTSLVTLFMTMFVIN